MQHTTNRACRLPNRTNPNRRPPPGAHPSRAEWLRQRRAPTRTRSWRPSSPASTRSHTRSRLSLSSKSLSLLSQPFLLCFSSHRIFLCGVGQVEAGGGAEDGARGIAPQDPRRALQGSALILGFISPIHSFDYGFLHWWGWMGAVRELDRCAPRDDGDQGRRGHVQLTGSRVLRHPHEVRHTPLLCSLPMIPSLASKVLVREGQLCAICVLTINIS